MPARWQGQSGQSSGSNQATTQVAPAPPQQTAPPPQNTVSETEFRHLQEQNELLREANEQLQSGQTRERALIETILLCEDKDDDEAMEEAVETFLKGPRQKADQKAEGDQLDSGKPSDDGCGLPSANPDEPGDGPPRGNSSARRSSSTRPENVPFLRPAELHPQEHVCQHTVRDLACMQIQCFVCFLLCVPVNKLSAPQSGSLGPLDRAQEERATSSFDEEARVVQEAEGGKVWPEGREGREEEKEGENPRQPMVDQL